MLLKKVGGGCGGRKQIVFHSPNITAVGLTRLSPDITLSQSIHINLISHIEKDGLTFSSLSIPTMTFAFLFSLDRIPVTQGAPR